MPKTPRVSESSSPARMIVRSTSAPAIVTIAR
jgi:hypothetical protein